MCDQKPSICFRLLPQSKQNPNIRLPRRSSRRLSAADYRFLIAQISNQFPERGQAALLKGGESASAAFTISRQSEERSMTDLHKGSIRCRTPEKPVSSSAKQAIRPSASLEGLGIADVLRPEAPEVVSALKEIGVERIAMVTGDNSRVASSIAQQAGVAEF